MSVCSCNRWTRRLGTLTLLGSVCGAALDTGIACADEPRPMPPVAELTASAVPLPPRDPNARPRMPRPQPTVQTVSQTVIDVVVTQPQPPEAPPAAIDPRGWEAAAPVDETAGRAQIALAIQPDESAEASIAASDVGLGAAPDFSELSSAWTTVASTDPENPTPLVEAGVMRSDAVFDGIPVLANDLAPVPTSESDDALSQTIVQFYALAPTPLDERPELAAPGPLAIAAAESPLTPVDTAADAEDAKPEADTADAKIDAAARARIDEALATLQKPLSSVRLTTALLDREPPDLATAAVPPGQPEVVWGAPWPDVKLASYRYTVPMYHRPLYFEQANFERCGESWWVLSPYVSAANFAGNIFLLPVHLVLQPPCQCQPSLGDCPTCSRYPLCPRGPLGQ